MHPNWLGISAILLGISSYFICFHLSRPRSFKVRIWLMFLTTLASIPAVSMALYYFHLVPDLPWYDEFRSIRGIEFTLILPFLASALIATFLRPLLRMLPGIGALILAVIANLKPFLGPIPAASFQNHWDGPVCLQSTPSTCGPASTATLLRHFGIQATEQELAAEAHSYEGGTEAWFLARAIRARGLQAHFHHSDQLPSTSELPAILGVRIGTLGHFIAVLGLDGNQFLVGDPLRGPERLAEPELCGRYTFTGFQLQIRKP